MTVAELKSAAMFLTNNDAADAADYAPHLLAFLNEGYDQLVFAYAKKHPAADDETYPTLTVDTDAPATPAWTHMALAYWAAWCLYRNGSPQKQQRGLHFRAAFEDAANRVLTEGGAAGQTAHFANIPN